MTNTAPTATARRLPELCGEHDYIETADTVSDPYGPLICALCGVSAETDAVATDAELAAARTAGDYKLVTLDWENGVATHGPIIADNKAAAFATIDRIMAYSHWPSSINAQISENGVAVWGQHGTDIYLNA